MNEIGADFITGMSPHDLADLQERNGQTDVGSQFVKKGSIDVALGITDTPSEQVMRR